MSKIAPAVCDSGEPRELSRAQVIQLIRDRQLTLVAGAVCLGLSERQLRRVMRRFEAEGPNGLVSRRVGKPNVNRTPADTEQRIVSLIREHYVGCGPVSTAQALEQHHGVKIDRETLRGIMMRAGLWEAGRTASAEPIAPALPDAPT